MRSNVWLYLRGNNFSLTPDLTHKTNHKIIYICNCQHGCKINYSILNSMLFKFMPVIIYYMLMYYKLDFFYNKNSSRH